MTFRRVAFISGVGIVTAGLLTKVAMPMSEAPAPAAQMAVPVTAVVRNDLGQLKWITTAATDYTPLEAEGRQLYVQSRCWYCHTQYYRPAAEEIRPWGRISADAHRWGPPAEPGEYVLDRPKLFGTKGIAPDLSREGLKYSDEWHLAHFWNPPLITQGSIMGGFSGLFDAPAEAIAIVADKTGARTLARTPISEKYFDFSSKTPFKLTPNEQGLLFVPTVAQGKYPLIWTPNKEYTGASVNLVVETRAIEALIAYVQKLGMNRGRWREVFEPEKVDGADVDQPKSSEKIAHGKEVYESHCIACHGVRGDGNGEAATFLYRQRPRNFTLGEFKFRLTKGPLPSDADLLRTISRGVRGTAMPAWFELKLEDRLAVIQYIKYELAVDRSDPANPDYYFLDDPPGEKLKIQTPPAPTAELLLHGKDIWKQAKCWECHGMTGRGDGEKAAGLKDDWGFPIRPANLTSGQFKSGPAVSDIYRTISTGLAGTPMPSFRAAFPDADRWALANYILSLSAYNDPLTALPLPIVPADRAALDDPKLSAGSPGQAYRLQAPVVTAGAAK